MSSDLRVKVEAMRASDGDSSASNFIRRLVKAEHDRRQERLREEAVRVGRNP